MNKKVRTGTPKDFLLFLRVKHTKVKVPIITPAAFLRERHNQYIERKILSKLWYE